MLGKCLANICQQNASISLCKHILNLKKAMLTIVPSPNIAVSYFGLEPEGISTRKLVFAATKNEKKKFKALKKLNNCLGYSNSTIQDSDQKELITVFFLSQLLKSRAYMVCMVLSCIWSWYTHTLHWNHCQTRDWTGWNSQPMKM